MTRSHSVEQTCMLLLSAAIFGGIAHAQSVSDVRLDTFAAMITDSTSIDTNGEQPISPAELRDIVTQMAEGTAQVEVRSQVRGELGWTTVAAGAPGTILCGHRNQNVSEACYYYSFFGWNMDCRPEYIGVTELIACDRVVGKGTGFFVTDTALFASPPNGETLRLIAALPTYMLSGYADAIVYLKIADGAQPRASSTLRRCAEILIIPYSEGESRYINPPECEVYQFDSVTQQLEHISGPNGAADGIGVYYDFIESAR